MILYLLPESLRSTLAKLHTYAENSITLFSGPRNYIGFKLRGELYPYLTRVAVVGDVVCTTFIEFVGVPRICIVDGKTLRTRYGNIEGVLHMFYNIHRCRNPPGTISSECLSTIASAMHYPGKQLVVVDGEEDLLALAAVLVGTKHIDYVAYGVPNEGVAVVDVEKFMVLAINLFSQFMSTQYLIRQG